MKAPTSVMSPRVWLLIAPIRCLRSRSSRRGEISGDAARDCPWRSACALSDSSRLPRAAKRQGRRAVWRTSASGRVASKLPRRTVGRTPSCLRTSRRTSWSSSAICEFMFSAELSGFPGCSTSRLACAGRGLCFTSGLLQFAALLQQDSPTRLSTKRRRCRASTPTDRPKSTAQHRLAAMPKLRALKVCVCLLSNAYTGCFHCI